MAQYGRNFYGTSYYGPTNLFTGWYQTNILDAEEYIEGSLDIEIKVDLPKASILYDEKYFKGLSDWYVDELSNIVTAKSGDVISSLQFEITTDVIEIPYLSGIRYEDLKVTVESENISTGVINTETFTIPAKTQAVDKWVVFKKEYTSFDMHTVTIETATGGTPNKIGSIEGMTTRIRLEGKGRRDNSAFNLYQEIPLTLTHVSDDTYLAKASTDRLINLNEFQFKVYLETSDNKTSPTVDYLKFQSGDTTARTHDGVWIADINMSKVAEKTLGDSKLFEKVVSIDWTETVPEATTLDVRSAATAGSGVDGGQLPDFTFSKLTVPYRKNTKRLRLKEGKTKGFLYTSLIAPEKTMILTNNKGWLNYTDQAYLPPNNTSTRINYYFLSNTTNIKDAQGFYRIEDAPLVTDKSLFNGDMNTGDLQSEYNRAGKPFYLKIELERDPNHETPVVDWITFNSQMDYEQKVEHINEEYSGVDYNGTGKGVLFETNTILNKFSYPQEVKSPEYSLIDTTGRPTELLMYFDTQKDEAFKDGRTNTLVDNKVWIEAKLSEKNDGINSMIRNYQYGGGEVKFPETEDLELAPIFTPSLKNNIPYKFYLLPYWETQYHTVKQGDTLDDIAEYYVVEKEDIINLNPDISYDSSNSLLVGQNIELPNTSKNDKIDVSWKEGLDPTATEEKQNYRTTMKFSQNAILNKESDVSSDTIQAKVKDSSIYGWVDWVSEEKIYNGFVNLNDIRSEYKRIHRTVESGASQNIQHIIEKDETLRSISRKYDVELDDLIWLNDTIEDVDSELVVGNQITIPNKIILPRIPAGVLTDENPYTVSIIYRSAKKKDETIIPENNMIISPLNITYSEKLMVDVPVVRGKVANGNDLLPHRNVKRIVSVKNSLGTITYNPYEETTKSGDYKLEQDRIYWSPTEQYSIEPKQDEVYYVTYYVDIPNEVTLTIDTIYKESIGIDRIWRSAEVKEFKGRCTPDEDFILELPEFEEWQGLPNNKIEDINYVIEDTDIWVKTYVEERNGKKYLIGTLDGEDPEKNWYPTIKTGFYYLGKDEYYLYSEPITVEPDKSIIPIANNVSYVEGVSQMGVSLRKGSKNLITKEQLSTDNEPVSENGLRKTYFLF